MSKLKVAVIFGGNSPEHEVSVITGVQALAAIPKNYDTVPIYVAKDGTWYTGDALREITFYQNPANLTKSSSVILKKKSGKVYLESEKSNLLNFTKTIPLDILFPCFHGGVGEGGWIQGLAEFFDIPLVGTGLTGAAIGMDKVSLKHIFAAAKLKQAPYLWFYRQEWRQHPDKIIQKINAELTYPLFVKPSRGGSSIGTRMVKSASELKSAIDLSCALDTRIVVESGIMGAREINLSILGNAGEELLSSSCEEVFHKATAAFLDFEEKYLPGNTKSSGMASTDRSIPAQIEPQLKHKIEEIGKTVFRLLDFSGLVRIDFLVKGQDVYLIEPNTIPGSLSFYIWDPSGIPFAELTDKLIKLALAHHQEGRLTTKNFASNILNYVESNYGSKLWGKLGPKLSR